MNQAPFSDFAGTRERHKATIRNRIQRHAIQLFEAQGYKATTANQIAAAAGVSPATFFRYFPNKEQLLLYDSFDELFIAALRGQPTDLPLVDAMRASLRQTFGALSSAHQDLQRARYRLVLQSPALRATLLSQTFDSLPSLATEIANRTGHSPDDATVQAFAGAFIGLSLSILLRIAQTPSASMLQYLAELDTYLATYLIKLAPDYQ